MDTLHTPRLNLVPLSKSDLVAYLEMPFRLELKLGVELSEDVLTEIVRRAIQMKIAKMETAPPGDHPWYTYWLIIVRAAGFGAGLIGFKGLDRGKQEVELGFGIDPEYAGRGYTTEAARTLIDWAFQDPEVEAVVTLGTQKANRASLRVQEKLGFQISRETYTTLDLRLSRADWKSER